MDREALVADMAAKALDIADESFGRSRMRISKEERKSAMSQATDETYRTFRQAFNARTTAVT